ncbi:MAG: hypothetical protein UHO11_05090 [Treponema sp.]|nr:hypothetical protein [Treponema sp.]
MKNFLKNPKRVLLFMCFLICSCSKDLSFEQADRLLRENQNKYGFQYFKTQNDKFGALQVNGKNLSLFENKFSCTNKYIKFLSVITDKNVEFIPEFDNLEQFEIGSKIYEKKDFPIINLNSLNNNIYSLSIYEMKILDINDLYDFKSLKKLIMRNCIYDGKINYENLSSLIYLEVIDDDRVDFMEFKSLRNLKYLTIRNCKEVHNLEFIECLNLEMICFDEKFYESHIVYINSLKKKFPNMKVFNGIH